MDDSPIAPVRAADAPALAELCATTFVEAYRDQIDPATLTAYVEENFGTGAIEQELADRDARFAWICRGAQPVAYLKLDVGDPGTVEVARVYVRASDRGRGLGRRLLDHAVEVARDRGRRSVGLAVWEHNADAIGFYERYGFRTVGETDFVLGRERQRDLLMRLDLDP